MKRKILLIIVMVAILFPNSGQASEDTFISCGNGQNFTYLLPEKVIINGNLCSGSIIIPDGVVAIGSEAFKNSKITSILLPNTLELISNNAFESTYLRKIVIPDGVSVIGESAFAYNNDLVEVVIPNSVTKIGAKAFNGSRLLKFNVPDSITKIESCTFGNLDFGQGSLSISIPNSVTDIEGCAFWNSGITNVVFGDSIKNLAGFSRNKLSQLTVPNSVVIIGANAFSNNPLFRLEIPNTVQTIDSWAFRNTYLSEIVLPESVKTIGEMAFADNPRLKTISIPDKLESLGVNVFLNTPLLQTILYCGEFTEFPIATICPQERREIIEKEKAEAKAAVLKDPRVAARAKTMQGFGGNIGKYVSLAYLEAEKIAF